MAPITVIKRNGDVESLDLNKWHKVTLWATEGITGVSASELELRSNVQFHDRIKTSDIMELTIKSAADLISEETPNYQFVGSRLVNYHLRKQVYGQHEPIPLFEHVTKVISAGFYDPILLEQYTQTEFNHMDTFINHDRDFDIAYVGLEQMRGKYLVKNRATGEIFETPQMAYILIAATLFADYPKDTRLKWVKNYYDAISTFDISLPTPVMAGVRTPQRQFSSCILVESDDSLDSINATSSVIVRYAAQRAGLGIGAGRIRSVGSPIRKGDATHTGIIPFIKYFQAAVKSCNQGGIRSASATLHYPIWHWEIEDLLVLKNNKGIEDNRARHLDYSVQINRLMYERLIANQDVTLFSPADIPELYEAFFVDQDRFKELYEKAERNTKLRKRKVRALDLFSALVQERKDTGRIYIMNVDHCNDHSSFKSSSPIKMSNLCQEITLPTEPLTNIDQEDGGEVAACILSAINWGKIKEPSDFEKPCMLAVRALDALIDIQSYPVKATRYAMLSRRSIGIGIINLAYWMAKNDLKYHDIDSEGLARIHEYVEAWSYYLLKASVDLAKEKGPCELYLETKYSEGILPIDTYKKEVDGLCKPDYQMNWKALRADMAKYGIRNSTLMALMPAETSCAVSNATNGIEPPRAFVSIKQSKDGVLKQVVPEYRRLKNKYDLLWDQKRPVGYLKICAVLQKFIDQSISTNTSYNPKHYTDEKIPLSELLKDILSFYRWGGKTLYYLNTNDGAGEIDVSKMVQSTNEETEEDCDSCKI